MHVAVIGAGVIGTLTAHYLHAKGCVVTVYESASKAASMTSSANGGQLSYSFCDALADPQLLSKMPGILAGRDPAFVVQDPLDPHFMGWGLKFLRHCTPSQRDANTIKLLELCSRSRALMRPLLQQFGYESNHTKPGKLVLLDTPPDAELRRRTQLKQAAGVDIRLLDTAQVLDLEPALANWSLPPQAGIYASDDEVADARKFTLGLVECLSKQGVTFQFNNPVERLVNYNGQRCQVIDNKNNSEFDACVIATGHNANQLLKPLGLPLPITAMAGYSITLPCTKQSPQRSLTALNHRIVFSPLGDTMRIAGFADLGQRIKHPEKRIQQLHATAQKLAPDSADYAFQSMAPWHGFRAITPDSQPIIRNIPGTSVFTNVGHGMLGWTLAAVTSDHLASLITSSMTPEQPTKTKTIKPENN